MGIRRMQAKDLVGVADIYADANLFARKKDILNWTREGLEKYPELNLVYELKGDVIGGVSAVMESRRVAVLNDIAVEKSHRNSRTGGELMSHIIKIIQKRGARRIKLWVHWKNAAAIPFYYRFGFRITKFSRAYNIKDVPNGEDLIHLERRI